jgi:hypothetical protein
MGKKNCRSMIGWDRDKSNKPTLNEWAYFYVCMYVTKRRYDEVYRKKSSCIAGRKL